MTHPHELMVGAQFVCAVKAGLSNAKTRPAASTNLYNRCSLMVLFHPFATSGCPVSSVLSSWFFVAGLSLSTPRCEPDRRSLLETELFPTLYLHNPAVLDYDFDRSEAQAPYRLGNTVQNVAIYVPGFVLLDWLCHRFYPRKSLPPRQGLDARNHCFGGVRKNLASSAKGPQSWLSPEFSRSPRTSLP